MSRPRNGWLSFSPSRTAPSRSVMPYWVTMARASVVAFSMSLPAPVVGLWNTSSSAARPPRGHQRVPALVVGGDRAFLVVHQPGALLRTGHDPVDGLVQGRVGDGLL